MNGPLRLEPARPERASAMAQLHRSSFDAPWSAGDIAVLLDGLGGYGVLAVDDDAAWGFLLGRAIAGEAEILTLAVEPRRRRQGLALALVEAAAAAARALAADRLFLEVAEDNAAAIGLYRRAGFAEVGRRPGYYAKSGAAAIDALIMRRDLNTGPA